MANRYAIIGYGVVGKAMHELIPEAVYYDVQPGVGHDQDEINECDVAFICVPTPQSADGSCDISAVEECIGWLTTPLIVLRSTVPPGTTEALARKHNKRLVFQPEYLGETAAHPYADVSRRHFIILGGKPEDTSRVADAYNRFYHSDVQYHFTDALTAEVTKYMENCFFAAKVTFCNEFFGIAKALGVEYNELRELWLADTRISRDHTFVYPEQRGFSGKCLPKDLAAIIARAAEAGYDASFLKAVEAVNEDFKAASADAPPTPAARLVPRKDKAAADATQKVR